MEKPTFKQRLDGFCKFIYNKESGTVLGRGGRSWAEIGLFYVVYYSCLAAFFAATIAVFYQTIDADKPKLQGDSSLLKGNPGMGFEPMPDIDTTLIRLLRGKEKNQDYIDSITKVLKEYEKAKLANEGADCTDVITVRKDAKEGCKVDYDELTKECNEGNSYGIEDGQPCILLKLNRIFGWSPKLWKDAADAGKSLPENIRNQYTNDRIWVNCDGENEADKDNIGKDVIKYFPQQGFPVRYYPYMKQMNYMSPLIFVKFTNATKYLGLMIECKAFAKNIRVDRQEKEGSVHFELLLDM